MARPPDPVIDHTAGFRPKAHVGELLLFYVRERHPNFPTRYGRRDTVLCDLVIFPHLDEPQTERNILIFQSRIVASLKDSVRTLPVLGRIKQTSTGPGRKPAYALGDHSERDAEHAVEYLASVDNDPFNNTEVRLDSPIEEAFWNAHKAHQHDQLDGLVTQYPVLAGRYRLDFALPDQKIGIELDGYEFHSSKKAFTKDRERQRAIEAAGWRIIRFSGSEINADPAECVRQATELITAFERR